jgi:hypothetical protein
VTLGVISGLPGLGKSFFFKQIQTALAAPQYEDIRNRACIVLKDAVSSEFRNSADRKASQSDVLNVAVERLTAAASISVGADVCTAAKSQKPMVLLFNMNINTDWIAKLVSLLEANAFRVCKVVVLAPPAAPAVSFQRLRASAVVLASDLRTGDESADLASTLLPKKAWEVLSGGFFSRPSAVCATRDLCVTVADTLHRHVPFEEVHYPVPLLKDDIALTEEIPAERPLSWALENVEFPSEEETAESVRRFIMSVDGCSTDRQTD